jgi:hypothetical protein
MVSRSSVADGSSSSELVSKPSGRTIQVTGEASAPTGSNATRPQPQLAIARIGTKRTLHQAIDHTAAQLCTRVVMPGPDAIIVLACPARSESSALRSGTILWQIPIHIVRRPAAGHDVGQR